MKSLCLYHPLDFFLYIQSSLFSPSVSYLFLNTSSVCLLFICLIYSNKPNKLRFSPAYEIFIYIYCIFLFHLSHHPFEIISRPVRNSH